MGTLVGRLLASGVNAWSEAQEKSEAFAQLETLCKRDALEKFGPIVEKHPDHLNVLADGAASLVHIAANCGSIRILLYLALVHPRHFFNALQHTDNKKRTALHYAVSPAPMNLENASPDHRGCVALLCLKGRFMLKQRDVNGKTPLELASSFGSSFSRLVDEMSPVVEPSLSTVGRYVALQKNCTTLLESQSIVSLIAKLDPSMIGELQTQRGLAAAFIAQRHDIQHMSDRLSAAERVVEKLLEKQQIRAEFESLPLD
jgi:hypothetical protein